MEKLDLEQIWKSITYSGHGQVSYRLMSIDSIPSLNLGINKLGQRCLLLELPSDICPEISENFKENISLWYYSVENCISIVLNDPYFEDLFNDLILSIYHKIYNIENSDSYSNLFVAYYFKWLSFLDNRNNKLSKEVIKGIWGEVFYLKKLLISGSGKVNDIIFSWQGPFDKGHDFVFEFIEIEIKTIQSGTNNIRISSEFQLENNPGKTLELVVLSVEDDKTTGLTLEALVHEVRSLMTNIGGDINVFADALFQKGLTFGNINEYNMYQFKPNSIKFFNCCDEQFPKIIKSRLPEEISNVRYNLKLNMLDGFLLSESEL